MGVSLNMHSKALTSFRDFFRPILHFLGMSSSPPPENEFPGETIVENWEAYLLERYRSRDSEKSPEYRSRMETLKVNAIRRYKEKKHVEHEYLIAQVSDPNWHQPRYLKIERTVEPLRTQDTIDRSSRQTISTLSSQSSLGVSKKLPARDRVSTTAGWPSSDICIDKLDCRDTQMILLDLAIVAKMVHDHSKNYDVFKRQCFWYSDVIVGILQKRFPRVQVATPDSSSLAEEHEQDAEMEVLDSKSGTFKRVPIYNRRMSAIKEIHEKFETYDTHIRSSVNHLNTSIFLLANHYHRSQKPQRLLRECRKRRRECRKRTRDCRKRGRRNGKRTREC
jgi:hypothetical protein